MEAHVSTGYGPPHLARRLDGYQGGLLTLAFSPGGRQLATGSRDGMVRVWDLDRSGAEQVLPAPAQRVNAIAFDLTQARLIAGFEDGALCVWDLETGAELWRSTFERPVRALACAPSTPTVAVGLDNGRLVDLDIDRNEIIREHTGHRGPIISLSFDETGSHLLSSAYDHRILFWEATGRSPKRGWDGVPGSGRFTRGGRVFFASGEYRISYTICDPMDASAPERTIKSDLTFRLQGRPVLSVASSPASALVACSSDDLGVEVVDVDRGEVAAQIRSLPESAAALAFDPASALLALGTGAPAYFSEETDAVSRSRDRAVYLWDISGVEPRVSGETSARALAAVRALRGRFIKNRFSALAVWFSTFDGHLARQEYHVCDRLLEEIRSPHYGLNEEEREHVDSREGALWLRRGIFHQMRMLFGEARKAYHRSLEIQRRLKFSPGEAQAEVALDFLEDESRTGQRQQALAQMRDDLQVMGGVRDVRHADEWLLTQRLKRADGATARAVLMAAFENHLTGPLVVSLDHSAAPIRMEAAALIAAFENPVDVAALRRALADPSWFVRWRAAVTLGRADPAPALISALIDALAAEPDPEVRRALCVALGELDSDAAIPALSDALADVDTEVRFAAVEALGAVGNRATIAAMAQMTGARDLMERTIDEAVAAAIEQIERRYPWPRLDEIWTCRRGPGGDLELTDQFLAAEAMVVALPLKEGLPEVRWQIEIMGDDSEQPLFLAGGGTADLLQKSRSVAPQGTAITGVAREDDPFGTPEPGDRVVCVEEYGKVLKGDAGKVMALLGGEGDLVLVDWDRDIGGHDQRGCRPGHGYWINGSRIEINSGSAVVGAETILVPVTLPTPELDDAVTVIVSIFDEANGIWTEIGSHQIFVELPEPD